MDLKEIKRIIVLMNEHGLVEVEICQGSEKLVLKKASPAAGPVQYIQAPFSAGAAAPAGAPSGVRPAGQPPAAPAADDAVTFNSPMVGTFYASADPKSPPFVKAGDRVTPETVVCLIEAMKMFNEVKAEMSGTIVDVLVDNQEAVEFNQPLFLIKP